MLNYLDLNKKFFFFLFAFFFFYTGGVKAQQLEIATYGTKLSKGEVEHIQMMLNFEIKFYNEIFNDTVSDGMRARVFGKQRQFNKYVNENSSLTPGRILGYFSPQDNELIVYRSKDDTQFMKIFVHEMSHALLRKKVSRPPTWLNEGLAVFFEGLELKDGAFVAEVRTEHVRSAYNSLKSKRNLKKFLNKPYDDFHKMLANVSYGMSWAVVYFLYFDNTMNFRRIILSINEGNDTYSSIEKYYPGGFNGFHKKLKTFYWRMFD